MCDSPSISTIREQVHLSESQMLSLCYDQSRYREQLICLINSSLKQCSSQVSLVYLQEAERLLEEGAGCGKVIEKIFIICVFHNTACCYFKDSLFSKAVEYVDAILFHLREPKKKSKRDTVNGGIGKKLQLAGHTLRYVMLTSQDKQTDISLQSGLELIRLYTGIFQQLRIDPTLATEESTTAESQELKNYLKSLVLFKSSAPNTLTKETSYLRLACYYLQKKLYSGNKNAKLSSLLERHIYSYSLGDAIDMKPMGYGDCVEEGGNQFSVNSTNSAGNLNYHAGNNSNYYTLNTRGVLHAVAELGIAYFLVSVNYLSRAKEQNDNQTDVEESVEFGLASVYHLLAVAFLSANVRCEAMILNQVIASYEITFKTNLLEYQQVSENVIDKVFDKVLIKDTLINNTNLGNNNCNGLIKKKKIKLNQNAVKDHNYNLNTQTKTYMNSYTNINSHVNMIATNNNFLNTLPLKEGIASLTKDSFQKQSLQQMLSLRGIKSMSRNRDSRTKNASRNKSITNKQQTTERVHATGNIANNALCSNKTKLQSNELSKRMLRGELFKPKIARKCYPQMENSFKLKNEQYDSNKKKKKESLHKQQYITKNKK